jgi:hypothetical protein
MAASPLAAQVHDFPALADLVLERTGPGRGLPELPLAWPSPDGSQPPVVAAPLGARPVDPAAVPLEELVRVAVGVLGELVLGSEPSPPSPAAAPRRLPWSRSFRVVGPPVAARRLRAALGAAGHAEGGRRPRVLLPAPPFDDALRQAWTARVLRGSQSSWRKFVRRRMRSGVLPPSVDLPRLAEAWAGQVGAERVHVVVASDDAALRRTAAEVLGIQEPAAPGPGFPSSPAEVDVLRRLNGMLRVRVDRERHRLLLAGVAVQVMGAEADEPLRVPDRCADWADAQEGRMLRALEDGGYAVHGDLDAARGRSPRTADRPRRRHVLDAALAACLRAAARREARPGEGAAR